MDRLSQAGKPTLQNDLMPTSKATDHNGQLHNTQGEKMK
jgi:hypothetical protein